MVAKGAHTRERILQQAMSRASSDGLDGLSIGVLADDLGLSKSGLFAHFGSKEELQIEVLRAASERFANEVARPAFRAPRGVPRIRALFDNWIRWLNDPVRPGGCIMIAAGVELDDREGRPRDFLLDTFRNMRDTLAKSARMSIEVGHFRPNLDPDQFAFSFYSLLLGYHHTRRLLRDSSAEARARLAFEQLLADANHKG